MNLSPEQSALTGRMHAVSRALARAFPTPHILAPRAAGIDISDSSIKWIVLDTESGERRVSEYGELALEGGIVQGGIVHDAEKLASVLSDVKGALGNVACAHAALPEEAAYVFSMQVPAGAPRQQVMRMIEFEFEGRVPIPPSAAVFDFNVIPQSGIAADTQEISVVVFPRDVAQAYADAFEAAHISLLSLEVEAHSIARAVSERGSVEQIALIADIGRARTGFAVVKRGYPIFTSTVEVGGDYITNALAQALSLTPEETVEFKNDHGLIADSKEHEKGVEVVSGVASAIADEIARHYHYWDTRRNEQGERMTPVGKVVLVGGSANLRGLPEYIAGRIHAKVEIGNVWENVASFSDYIPPIDFRVSLQYATAVGLALRGFK